MHSYSAVFTKVASFLFGNDTLPANTLPTRTFLLLSGLTGQENVLCSRGTVDSRTVSWK